MIGLPGAPHTANAVDAGLVTSCAVTNGLSAACWGQMTGSGGGLLADHTSAMPVTKVPPGEVSQVTAAYGGCALIRNGGLATALRCWGDNNFGELGNGWVGGQSDTPAMVSGGSFLSDGASIGLSMGQTACGLDSNQAAQCWGFNGDGEVGDGTTTSTGTPAVVQEL